MVSHRNSVRGACLWVDLQTKHMPSVVAVASDIARAILRCPVLVRASPFPRLDHLIAVRRVVVGRRIHRTQSPHDETHDRKPTKRRFASYALATTRRSRPRLHHCRSCGHPLGCHRNLQSDAGTSGITSDWWACQRSHPLRSALRVHFADSWPNPRQAYLSDSHFKPRRHRSTVMAIPRSQVLALRQFRDRSRRWLGSLSSRRSFHISQRPTVSA